VHQLEHAPPAAVVGNIVCENTLGRNIEEHHVTFLTLTSYRALRFPEFSATSGYIA
jgi:hypothetical protein